MSSVIISSLPVLGIVTFKSNDYNIGNDEMMTELMSVWAVPVLVTLFGVKGFYICCKYNFLY